MIYNAQYYGILCAAKRTRFKNDKKISKSLRDEYKFLVSLRHPCVISLVGILSPQDDPVVLMERMKMSLTEFLENKRFFLNKIMILYDVACGLCYIHSKNIIHCDLNGNNILLANSFNAKIADFGQAVTYDPKGNDNLPTNPGNIHHMPPEASSHDYSPKLDIFSFGCVMIHTVTQRFPIPSCDRYINTSNAVNYKKVSEADRRLEMIQRLKRDHDGIHLHKIVVECLQDHPESRPTAAMLHLQLKKYMEKCQKTSRHRITGKV